MQTPASARHGVASQLGFQSGADALVRADRDEKLKTAIWKEDPLGPIKPGDRCFRVRERAGFRLHYRMVLEERTTNGLYVNTPATGKVIEFVPLLSGVNGEYTVKAEDHYDPERGGLKDKHEPGSKPEKCDACQQIHQLEVWIERGKQPLVVDFNKLRDAKREEREEELAEEFLASPSLASKVARKLGVSLDGGFASLLKGKGGQGADAK